MQVNINFSVWTDWRLFLGFVSVEAWQRDCESWQGVSGTSTQCWGNYPNNGDGSKSPARWWQILTATSSLIWTCPPKVCSKSRLVNAVLDVCMSIAARSIKLHVQNMLLWMMFLQTTATAESQVFWNEAARQSMIHLWISLLTCPSCIQILQTMNLQTTCEHSLHFLFCQLPTQRKSYHQRSGTS